MIYNYENLPANGNLNSQSYCIEVRNQFFVQKGMMIAYYGALKFESLVSSQIQNLVLEGFNAPLYLNNFMVVMGTGKLILGDKGKNIASYNLNNNHLTVKCSHVLGFESTLTCSQSTFPGYLTFSGSGQFITSSNGPVYFIDPPARVDEQALLGWVDVPTPSYHYDYMYLMRALTASGILTGMSPTGEEVQIEFTGQGKVLVQSTEAVVLNRATL